MRAQLPSRDRSGLKTLAAVMEIVIDIDIDMARSQFHEAVRVDDERTA